jgi:hypothetical protein
MYRQASWQPGCVKADVRGKVMGVKWLCRGMVWVEGVVRSSSDLRQCIGSNSTLAAA